jgi:hypothetical protein
LRGLIRKELDALALLHKAVVDIALGQPEAHWIARRALKRMAVDYPQLVELLLARAAEAKRNERDKRNQVSG